MTYFNNTKPISINLKRDLAKHIKRGNPWVFSDAVEATANKPSGVLAQLFYKKELVATGIYCSKVNLAFRVLAIGNLKINDQLIEKRILDAAEKRKHLLSETNNTFRLINGEGDDLPGLVCDIYANLAVIKLDGDSSVNFWKIEELANFILKIQWLKLTTIYYKRRSRSEDKGEIIAGKEIDLTHHHFIEHQVKFVSNIIDAAKTGFFIDQRENRKLVGEISRDKTVLNLFGYTGGFSVYAGIGKAREVTTVDIAPEAIKASETIWQLNQLENNKHHAILADCFAFIEEAKQKKQTWDIVITDPPSFAPNHKAVENAKDAYIKIFTDSIKLTQHAGYFIASSCSGHITSEQFLEICQEAASKTRARIRVLTINGQPIDHPFPLAMPELRYLKFVLMQIYKD